MIMITHLWEFVMSWWKRLGSLNPEGGRSTPGNYYMLMAIAKHMFNKYGWTVVGTIVPMDKKSSSDQDIPFLKLQNGSRNELQWGWFREAAIKIKNRTGNAYYIQCTTWRDNRQVWFLSSDEAGYTEGLTVEIHSKKKKKQDNISGPRAQRKYISMMLTGMIMAYTSLWSPSRQSVTTLESSSEHWTVLFTLSLLQYTIIPNLVLVRVIGRSISIETMTAMTFKLILSFL